MAPTKPNDTSPGLIKYLGEVQKDGVRKQVMKVLARVQEDLGPHYELFAQDDYATIHKRMRMSNPKNGMSPVLCPAAGCDATFINLKNTSTMEFNVAGHVLDIHPEMILSDSPHKIAHIGYAVMMRTSLDYDELQGSSLFPQTLVSLAKHDQSVLKELLGEIDCNSPAEAIQKFPDVYKLLLRIDPVTEEEQKEDMDKVDGLLTEEYIDGLSNILLTEYIVACRELTRDIKAHLERQLEWH